MPEEARPQNSTHSLSSAYLYGIGKDSAVDFHALLGEFPDMRALQFGGLAVFVRYVSPDEYSDEALRERLQDQEWLISAAREHHEVVARIHQIVPILPAKFGSVYESVDDLHDALTASSEAILERLTEIDGCDEWAVHVFRQDDSLVERLLAEDPGLRELSEQLDGASEGRAYLLRQQLQTRLSDAVETHQLAIAREALDGLRSWINAITLEQPRESTTGAHGEVEVARASVLVHREAADSFLAAIEERDQSTDGLSLQVTGPWPAYSFAQLEGGELHYG